MENAPPQPRSPTATVGVLGLCILAGAGIGVFHAAWHFEGDEHRYWLPGLGVGIALVSWLGWRVLPLLLIDLLVVRFLNQTDEQNGKLVVGDALLHCAQIGLSWWLYYHVARGSRWLDDPRSASLFLILIPGGLSALAAILQGLLWKFAGYTVAPLPFLTALLWLSRMVGIMVVTPFLLVFVTPLLVRWRVIAVEMPSSFFGESSAALPRRGEWIELVGLTFTTSVLVLLLLESVDAAKWTLWGCCLILIVWTCIRQGLRGGCFSAGITAAVALLAVQTFEFAEPIAQSGLQGNLLAFCSTALLVGVSSSWVRTNEARYRHVVSRMPVVLYSARMPQAVPSLVKTALGRDSKRDMNMGPSISKLANVLLVSPASKEIMGCEPDALIGPFSLLLGQIVPDDHELVIAALAQLCLQKQPVSCEYRLRVETAKPSVDPALKGMLPNTQQTQIFRWVRDTLTPHYTEDGLVDGWEGLIEEITEQRALSQNLRKITNMLQVLITNLPTGVFFVQAPTGYPILVNARARQLLGQREDMSAGLENLSRIYRLHRPDGSDYPAEELPISKALRLGVSCRANDIVVHRADGRKIPLIVWAAPVDLNNTGVPDAAVWVLEDLTAMQQAEVALRESEVRLRAVIETMGEGVIVQDANGIIIECNPAACAILDTPRERLLNRMGMIDGTGALQETGAPFTREQLPDQRALREGVPMRGVVVGLPINSNNTTRWLLVSALPLPVGPGVGSGRQKARVVTTFADITQQLQFQESLRQAKEKYQNLVETLPFMVVQRDRDFNITYLNPGATQLTGYSAEQMMTPGFYRQIIVPEDLPAVLDAAARVTRGESTRLEYRFVAHDKTTKTVLAFIHPNRLNGAIVGSTNLVIDVTTQRRLEEELQRSRHLELVGKLASGTVHDFNNLLAVMISLAELAKLEMPAEHTAQSYLGRLVEVGEQASHLAGQILAFGKQRSKSQYPVDLNAVVTQTVKMLNSVMPPQVTLETHLEPTLPVVLGNEGQLKQVLMNLCLNARDSMPGGGHLTIRTDLATPPKDNHAVGPADRWVHLLIADTGHGMEETVRLRIFEPFFSTKERGTGLGMAVVHQIIHEFGGRIEVWSEPGVGTRMDIWLRPAGADTADSM